MLISDWSSDVCSSDLVPELLQKRLVIVSVEGVEQLVRLLEDVLLERVQRLFPVPGAPVRRAQPRNDSHQPRDFVSGARLLENLQIGRASTREKVCQYISSSVFAITLKKKNNKN